MAPQEIYNTSEFEVVTRELYQVPSREPTVNGCLDPRLVRGLSVGPRARRSALTWRLRGCVRQGTSNKAMQCATCQAKMADCPGHYAHIQLHLPVFHIGYFKATIQLLQNICKVRVRSLGPTCTWMSVTRERGRGRGRGRRCAAAR
jgi:DNA-directed RNA polymerase III subunit RPC1